MKAGLQRPGPEMDFSMASTAKRNEIFFYIALQKAARLQMMHLNIF